MELGSILIRHRSRTHLTQKRIADQLGIAQSTYNAWESDQTSYKVEYLPQLAAIFGVRMRDLLPPEPEDIPTTPIAHDHRDELIELLRQNNVHLTRRVDELERQLLGHTSAR
jgi:transcriptional regulator with XRE-family HTH domain